MRVPRVGDSGFASHLEDHKLLYVPSKYCYWQPREEVGPLGSKCFEKEARSALPSMKKTKIEFSGHPTPQTDFLDPPMHHKYSNHAVSIQYCSIVSGTSICLFWNSQRSMRWIDGVGVAQHIWRDFTWISESWAWQGRVGAFGLFVCLFWLAWLDSLHPSQQSFGLVGMGLPGWIQ